MTFSSLSPRTSNSCHIIANMEPNVLVRLKKNVPKRRTASAVEGPWKKARATEFSRRGAPIGQLLLAKDDVEGKTLDRPSASCLDKVSMTFPLSSPHIAPSSLARGEERPPSPMIEPVMLTFMEGLADGEVQPSSIFEGTTFDD